MNNEIKIRARVEAARLDEERQQRYHTQIECECGETFQIGSETHERRIENHSKYNDKHKDYIRLLKEYKLEE